MQNVSLSFHRKYWPFQSAFFLTMHSKLQCISSTYMKENITSHLQWKATTRECLWSVINWSRIAFILFLHMVSIPPKGHHIPTFFCLLVSKDHNLISIISVFYGPHKRSWKMFSIDFIQLAGYGILFKKQMVVWCTTTVNSHFTRNGCLITCYTQIINETITNSNPVLLRHVDKVMANCWISHQASEWGRKVM